MQESKQPYLEVISPEGQLRKVPLPLTQNPILIGRDQCNITLGPHSNSFLSRPHCSLEREQSRWWLVAHGKNATWLCLNNNTEKKEWIHDRALIKDKDSFCMLGYIDEDGARHYWLLTLHDPEHTETDPDPHPETPFLKCNSLQKTVTRVQGKESKETGLPSLQWKLIEHMFERNKMAGNRPVLCTNEELLEAAYGEPLSLLKQRLKDPQDSLKHIIEDLRYRIEINSKKPKFLITYEGRGHILHTHPSSK